MRLSNSSKLYCVLLASVAIAACSSGSGSSTSGSNLVSTPPPPPPAPPAPSSNASLSNLTVSEEFYAASATIAGEIGILPSIITGATVASSEFDAQSTSSTISYDAGADSFRVEVGVGPRALTQTFAPANIVAAESDATITTYDAGDTRFVLLNANDPTLDLSYVTLAAWVDANAGGSDSLIGFSVFGVETPFADVPTTGTATYTGEVSGGMVEGGTLYNFIGVATVDADFAATSVDTTLDIGRAPLGSSAYLPWATIESTAGISQFTNSVSGNDTASFGAAATITAMPGASGSLSGRFFGPNAEEVGGEFSISDPGTFDAAGVFLGRQP